MRQLLYVEPAVQHQQAADIISYILEKESFSYRIVQKEPNSWPLLINNGQIFYSAVQLQYNTVRRRCR